MDLDFLDCFENLIIHDSVKAHIISAAAASRISSTQIPIFNSCTINYGLYIVILFRHFSENKEIPYWVATYDSLQNDIVKLLEKTPVSHQQPPFKYNRAGCSKLTTSLVNILLNFQELISQICQYFLLKKCEKLLQQCKSFSHFFNKKFQCIWLKSHKTLNKLTS